MILATVRPVMLQVIYHMPMHPSLLQEFTWSYEDHVPDLIRTHKFLNHWKKNIQAVISDVSISIATGRHRSWQRVDGLIKYN